MVAVLVHKWGIRGRRFRSNLFWFKVVFSGIQDKGVPVIIAVDTRADLQKLAEVVSEPTSVVSAGILSIPGFVEYQGSTISTV